MKKIVFGLVFSSLILGACGGNNASSESSTSMSDDTTESSLRQKISDLKSENDPDSASGNVKMGQAVKFTSGESITVTEVKADDSISLMNPVDGEHPVVVTAIVENKTDSPISFNAHTFDIYDGNDELGRLDANTYSNNIPNEIAGGKKATVVIYFGVKGNAPYSVTYGPATWSE